MSQPSESSAEWPIKSESQYIEKQSSPPNLKMSPVAEKLLIINLLVFLVFGLFLGFVMAFSIPLTSDTVNAGLYAMEISHGNFQYTLPANNPYLFTDYILQIPVQLLTGYSPVALVLTGYIFYVLIVIASAALVLRLAGPLEALIAAALVANLPATGLQYLIAPLYHSGTIFYILISLAVFYSNRPPLYIKPGLRIFILALLQFLGVFSDTLMLPFFTLPLIIYAIYQAARAGKITEKRSDADISPSLWLISAVPALAVFAWKTRGGTLWPGGPIISPGSAVGTTLGSQTGYTDAIGQFMVALFRDSGGMLSIVLVLLVIAVLRYRKDRFLHLVLILGSTIMLFGFLSMTIEGDPARYLTPIVVVAFLVIATGTKMREAGIIFPAIVVVLLLVLVAMNAWFLWTIWPVHDYNNLDREIIGNLENDNVTHAYADYWTANLYTYLSGGRIQVEPCTISDDRLEFYGMNVAPRWAQVWPDGNDTAPKIITWPGDSLYNWTEKINIIYPPEQSISLYYITIDSDVNLTAQMTIPVGTKIYGNKGCFIYIYNDTLPTLTPVSRS